MPLLCLSSLSEDRVSKLPTLPRWSLSASLLLCAALTGCPEPVATNEGAVSPGGQLGAQPSSGGQPGAMPGGTAGGAPGGTAGGTPGTTAPTGAATAGGQLPNGVEVPQAGTFGSIVPDAELEPRYAQDDITDGWTISGTTVCGECEGKVLVRVLPPPPDQGGMDQEIHLVTTLSLDAAGPFSLKVPKDYEKAVLQVVDDANEDGKPSSGERMGLPKDGPVALGKDVSGLTLEVGVFPEMPAMDGSGNPMGEAPTGGAAAQPGPDAAAAGAAAGGGTPPEGAPPDGAPPGVAPTPGEGGPPPEAVPPAG